MATSSIFAQVKITDPQKAELFVNALEASEKAQIGRERTAPAIRVMRDTEDIRELLSKRILK